MRKPILKLQMRAYSSSTGLAPPDRLSANRTANLKTERAGGKRRRNLGYPYGILACAQ